MKITTTGTFRIYPRVSGRAFRARVRVLARSDSHDNVGEIDVTAARASRRHLRVPGLAFRAIVKVLRKL